jgi:hypothetical protein
MIELFVKDSDTSKYLQLDLLGTEPIKMTMSIDDIGDLTASTSNYTKIFRVPNTGRNGKFFKSAFNVNGIDFDPTISIDSYFNINGLYYTSGTIQLQTVYHNILQDKIEYEIYFIGDIASFGAKINNVPLNQIDLSEYGYEINISNVTSMMNQNDNTNIEPKPLIYPLVEWGYTYDKDKNPEQSTVSFYDGTYSKKGFTNISYPLNIRQLKPILSVKTILNKVFEYAGYTISNIDNISKRVTGSYSAPGDNFTDIGELYMLSSRLNSPYLDSAASSSYYWSNNWSAWEPIEFNENNYYLADRKYKLPLNTPFNDNKFLAFNDNTFTMPESSSYALKIINKPPNNLKNLSFILDANGYHEPGTNAYIRLKDEDDNILSTDTGTYKTIDGFVGVDFLHNDTITLNTGVKYYFEIEFPTNDDKYKYLLNSGIIQLENINNFNPRALISDTITMDQFIKTIAQKFNLRFIPDKYIAKAFNIVPWNTWINPSEDNDYNPNQYDWSRKLDISKDVVITSTWKEFKRKIKFSSEDDSDYINYNYKQIYKENIGTYNYDSNIELIKDTIEIKDIFAPLTIENIASTGSNYVLIPHIAKDSADKLEPIPYIWSGDNITVNQVKVEAKEAEALQQQAIEAKLKEMALVEIAKATEIKEVVK